MKGITLVSLVISIIVLLILVGVTVYFAIGKQGMFTATEKSVEEYNKQEATEQLNFKITSIQISVYAQSQRLPTLQELADGLYEDKDIEYVKTKEVKLASLGKIEIGDNQSIFTKLKKYPYEFEINSSLQLASINGVKIAENSKEIDELKLLIEQQNEKINQLNTQIQAAQQKNNELNTQIQAIQQKDNTVSSLTFSITSGRIKGNKKYLRQTGKVVSVEIDGDTGSQNIDRNTFVVIATGLPKCASTIQELNITIDNVSEYTRCWIDNSGQLIMYTSATNYTGNIFIGGTYICQ